MVLARVMRLAKFARQEMRSPKPHYTFHSNSGIAVTLVLRFHSLRSNTTKSALTLISDPLTKCYGLYQILTVKNQALYRQEFVLLTINRLLLLRSTLTMFSLTLMNADAWPKTPMNISLNKFNSPVMNRLVRRPTKSNLTSTILVKN